MNNKLFSSKLFSFPLLMIALIFGLWLSYTTGNHLDLPGAYKISIGIMATLLFYFSSGWLLRGFIRTVRAFNHLLDNTSIEILVGGTGGLLLGVFLGLLSSYPLSMINGSGAYLTIIIFFLFGYTGLKIGVRRAADVFELLPGLGHEKTSSMDMLDQPTSKVLDTSAIIDGRIYDVCASKFLEGQLIIPIFVIEELQHIADSSDPLRRNKGRRGLELLAKMQKHPAVKIDIIEENIPEEKEVDMKLIRLCKQMNASIITTDYNLNKVAELHGIRVLNINELTNAVKVVVYPGETMQVSVLKEGKEPGQGVGYLEDGTMVVVEDAQDEIGNTLEVMVTSVFQTAAGRMIFTRKLKEEQHSNGHTAIQGVHVQEVNMYG